MPAIKIRKTQKISNSRWIKMFNTRRFIYGGQFNSFVFPRCVRVQEIANWECAVGGTVSMEYDTLAKLIWCFHYVIGENGWRWKILRCEKRQLIRRRISIWMTVDVKDPIFEKKTTYFYDDAGTSPVMAMPNGQPIHQWSFTVHCSSSVSRLSSQEDLLVPCVCTRVRLEVSFFYYCYYGCYRDVCRWECRMRVPYIVIVTFMPAINITIMINHVHQSAIS